MKTLSCGFVCVLAVCLLTTSLWGAETLQNVVVKNAAELEKAADTAQPGTTIIIINGTYPNFVASTLARGTREAPITIRAETPGKVVFTEESSLTIDGTWVTASGFIFRDGNPPSPIDPLDFSASALYLKGMNNRITECSVIDYSKNYRTPEGADPAKKGFHKWVGIWGMDNRVDHCLFQGKRGGGTLLTVWRDTAVSNNHRIDHNAFIDVAYGNGQNGWETIRLGDSSQSQSRSNSIVEYNYFERCDGEIEFISNKSGGNIYRFNTVINSKGCLTLRHGSDCIVENNVILQNGIQPSGGIRVMDKNHIIRNNYIEGVRPSSDTWGGIVFMNHNLNPPLNDYWPVENILVEHNSIVNSQFSIVLGGGRGKQAPISAHFKNNIIRTNIDGASDFTVFQKGKMIRNLSFLGNVFFGSTIGLESTELGDSLNTDPVLAKVQGIWLSPEKTKGFQPVSITKKEETGPQSFLMP